MVEPVYPFWVTSERNLEAQPRTENLIWLHPKEHLSVEHSMQKREGPLFGMVCSGYSGDFLLRMSGWSPLTLHV